MSITMSIAMWLIAIFSFRLNDYLVVRALKDGNDYVLSKDLLFSNWIELKPREKKWEIIHNLKKILSITMLYRNLIMKVKSGRFWQDSPTLQSIFSLPLKQPLFFLLLFF